MLPDAAVIVVAVLLFLAIIVFTFGLLGWCHGDGDTSLPMDQSAHEANGYGFIASNSKLMSSFKYRRVAEPDLEASSNTECIICLAAFEEDESVRQINSCKHIFHETCIENWIYSRPCCPLCRTNINQPTSPDSIPTAQGN